MSEDWLKQASNGKREPGELQPITQADGAPSGPWLKIAVLCVLGLSVAVGVWMGRYRFSETVLGDGESYPIRISRFSGRAEVLYRGAWQPSSVISSLDKPLQDLGLGDIEKLKANSVEWDCHDPYGVFDLNLYNGSGFTLQQVVVEITVKDAHGAPVLHREYPFRMAQEPGKLGFYINSPGFSIGPQQSWSWDIVSAKGTKP